jgi:hypothetical protein
MAEDTIAKMQKLVEDLSKSQGKDIPGLNFENVSNIIIEKDENFQKSLEGYSSEERKKIIDQYKQTIKDDVNSAIASIKLAYSNIVNGIESIGKTVEAAIISIALPPAISVPPAAPNPLYSLSEAKQKKNQLTLILDTLFYYFNIILTTSIKIMFPLPEIILVLLDNLVTTKKLLDTIPI